jgi:hypothetical protein
MTGHGLPPRYGKDHKAGLPRAMMWRRNGTSEWTIVWCQGVQPVLTPDGQRVDGGGNLDKRTVKAMLWWWDGTLYDMSACKGCGEKFPRKVDEKI